MGRYPGWYLDAGYGPGDVEEPDPGPPPSEVVVEVFMPFTYVHPEWGVEVTELAPASRSWPMFASKAAYRWAEWAGRKYGEKNVRVDYA